MKTRKSSSLRLRRRRIILQLLASLTMSAGAAAYADELDYFAELDGRADLAYYAVDLDADQYDVQPVAAQVQLDVDPDAPPEPLPIPKAEPVADPAPAAPVADSAPNSPIDGDAFLDAADLDTLEPPVTEADVDAIVEETQAPPMTVETPQFAPLPRLEPISSFVGLPTAFAATAGTPSSAPAMIGDNFGLLQLSSMFGATVALAGGDRRFKVAENVSPIPQDRVFFNFNHFENALRDVNGQSHSLDRYTFGVEKTFYNGLASIETRIPFAGGLDATQVVGRGDNRGTEFGNLAFGLKANLMSGDCWMLSGGTTMTLPTGDDYEIFNGGTRTILVQNDSVHLAPFLGYVTQPNNCWFAQGFIQADFDVNGNDVYTTGNTFAGVLQDQNLLFMDASIGRWIHRNCDPCARISAIAAIAELHYTSTLNDTDRVAGISNPFNRMDILNATGALLFEIGKSTLRVGAAAPLTQDEESLFDAEVIVQFNRHF